MATIQQRRPRRVVRVRVPSIRDYGAPHWFERLPGWVGAGGVLVLLVGLSAFIRVHYLDGELWSDEANTVTIASHSFGAIFGLLRQGGGAPLYFLVLHVWISLFGSSEIVVHALSVLFGLLTIPVGMWLGWSLFGRRAGFMLAALLAFDGFLTQYAEEARMYELMALLGLIGTGAFLHAFVRRRRGYLLPFGAVLALLMYTDDWGAFFWAGAIVALVPVLLRAEPGARRRIALDALLVFGAATVLYVPWLPTLIHQIAHATAPFHYAPLLGANIPRQMLGSDRVSAVLVIAAVAGLVPLLAFEAKRSLEAVAVWSLIGLTLGGILIALLVSAFAPDWVARYFAPLVAPLLVIGALGCARSGILGLVLVVVTCSFLANPASFIPTYKSDMKDVAGEVAPDLRSGDVVLMAQPEQTPLAWYYLPGGLRYDTVEGADPHPTWVDWDGAMTRLRNSRPAALARRLVASLAPGQHLLLIRPLTEGEANWKTAWAALVRRRSAQLGAALADSGSLRAVALAPHYYRGSCCTASSAVVYVKR